MFGNLRDFISVVQDGLSTNNNIRQTLQEVQKVKNIFTDRSKSSTESKVNYGVGGELLDKYQEQWTELHANAESNAKAAEEVDKVIMELHETAKSRLKSATEMAQNLTLLPNLTASVAQCIDSLKNVETLLKTLEQDLVEFEDQVERNNMEKWKLDHHYQLTVYREKKMQTLEEVRSKLSKEDSERRMEAERQKLADLQAKRENSAAAFQSDVAYYLSSGHIPTKPTPAPKLDLEQVQLDEDPEDLEKFLDS